MSKKRNESTPPEGWVRDPGFKSLNEMREFIDQRNARGMIVDAPVTYRIDVEHARSSYNGIVDMKSAATLNLLLDALKAAGVLNLRVNARDVRVEFV